MPESITLQGCTPEPLSGYLKALGVLRLVGEASRDRNAKDAHVRGYWQNDAFVLVTDLSQQDLVQFFLQEYEPTPLTAPWNGKTGFYPQDNPKTTLDPIRNAKAKRLVLYQQTIKIAQQQVDVMGLTAQPEDKETKRRLLERLRNHLPDAAIKWLDTCALITSEDVKFPPLTGTGGNDGNFEFSRTFLQQLQKLIDFETGQPTATATSLLHAALFNETRPGLRFSGKIGQFNPIAVGGANAAPGYDANSRVNPWDYVLMLEGILLFTAGATRRYEQLEPGTLAYPFTVHPSSVGYGSAAEGDEARAELWTPLWSAPTGLQELQLLFGEGRVKVGDRPARDGLDFYRAVSRLSRDRGLDEFVRYSFQVRNGQSCFAIPVDRFQPPPDPPIDHLTEIDDWLAKFKQAVQETNTPASIKRAYRNLETAIVDLSRARAVLLDVLIALGNAEKCLDHSLKFTQAKFLYPLPLLKADWIEACVDSSCEFRLGLALASQGLRQRLVRVRLRSRSRFSEWSDNEDGVTVWQTGDVVNNLIALLKRAAIEAQLGEKSAGISELTRQDKYKPFAALDDIADWIHASVDDKRIEAIARGLSLVNLSQQFSLPEPPKLAMPVAYSLVAIAHHRHLKRVTCQTVFGDDILAQDLTLPRVPALLRKLAAGNSPTATELAIRRLSASGLKPALPEGIYEPRDRTLRIAAALAFPISALDLARLLKQIRKLDPKK